MYTDSRDFLCELKKYQNIICTDIQTIPDTGGLQFYQENTHTHTHIHKLYINI